MTTDSLDHLTLCAALELANRAPSIYNSQPWQWRVGPHSMSLYASTDGGLPRTDTRDRDTMVSCGATLHHAAVALAALGWRTFIRRFPDSAEPEHLAFLQTNSGAPDGVDIALAAAIPRRRTDPRHYSSWPVAMADIVLMSARAARLGVTLRRVECSDAFTALIAQAINAHAGDQGYTLEMRNWTGRYEAADVVADGHGSILALGTASDDVGAALRAGEATSAVMLTATAQGLASCDVSEVLEVDDTRAALRTSTFDGERFPQAVLRVGWPPLNAEPLPATPRRPLGEGVRWLDGSVFVV
ncbi:nitroreductase [Mycolicibacterium sp. BK634]|uniref:NAD(P)H nitroreductase n=1 Tax=Mycolicibacterium sp. BK634 TaxID=2587099 RepID=UPI00160AFB1E|nr:NAD(P)H nitroreductase [Mycolicibacterium sp. BK634]MBB3752696.1 nitroreductase [Mycolicibacterium sp. BK634]